MIWHHPRGPYRATMSHSALCWLLAGGLVAVAIVLYAIVALVDAWGPQ